MFKKKVAAVVGFVVLITSLHTLNAAVVGLAIGSDEKSTSSYLQSYIDRGIEEKEARSLIETATKNFDTRVENFLKNIGQAKVKANDKRVFNFIEPVMRAGVPKEHIGTQKFKQHIKATIKTLTSNQTWNDPDHMKTVLFGAIISFLESHLLSYISPAMVPQK